MLKGESLHEAVHRIADMELDADVEVRQELGPFEHFYESSDVGCQKHYVAHGFHLWTDDTVFHPDDQHVEIAVIRTLPTDLHEYVEAYLDAANLHDSSAYSR